MRYIIKQNPVGGSVTDRQTLYVMSGLSFKGCIRCDTLHQINEVIGGHREEM